MAAARDEAIGDEVARAELAPAAEAWLDSIRELGYLPAALEDEVLDRLTVRVEGTVTVDDARRIAAEVFFERTIEPDAPGFGLLDEEWKAVFS